MLTIQANKRGGKESVSVLRDKGVLPAVFYGAGKVSTPISISLKDFEKLWKSAGESTAITINTDSGPIDAMIHEVQVDPVKSQPIHVDFLAIDVNKAIRVKVSLEFVGVSEVVKTGAGILIKVMHELEIEALPKNLPHNIEVDISKLATLTDQIKVSDLRMPAGVSAMAKEDEVVAAITEQKEEKTEEVVAPVDLSQIEVEKKGKKEEEGAPAEEAKS